MNKASKTDIVSGLRSVISDDDSVVLIHPNVFSFGAMENATEEIMDAVFQALGPERTLLMPSFTLSFCKTGQYHHQNSPSETGALTEQFRQHPGALRTPCPINSFVVMGPSAGEFMQYADGETCWGTDSVYQALYDNNALIVGLGERLALKASIFHYAEERESVPYRYFKTFKGQADFGDGPRSVSKKMFVRRLDLPVVYDYAPAVERLAEASQFTEVKVGGSVIQAFHAADAVDSLRESLREDPLSSLSSRGDYEAQSAKRSFVFMGGSNLDLTSRVFESEYRSIVNEECRVIPVAFNQYKQDVLDPESGVRVADPDYVVFLEHADEILGDLLRDPIGAFEGHDDIAGQVNARTAPYLSFIRQARGLLSGTFLVANLETLHPSPLGNADVANRYGNREIIHLANRALIDGLEGVADVMFFDFAAAVQRCGAQRASAKKYWYLGRVPFSNELAAKLSRSIVGNVLAAEGRTARLIVVDLDNTMWGGAVGEEGIAGIELGGDYPGNVFKDFQLYLKALSRRGVALAIASKNEHSVAVKAIEEHPEMVIREEDFAAVRINWDDKASNILAICQSLGLGTYSALFLDDNPVERESVKRRLPDCIVPDLPKDPSEWTDFLSDYPYLQAVRLTDEDLGRSQTYAKSRQIETLKESFEDVEAFLKDLEMRLFLDPYDESNQARVLQLFAKTNQLNTTTNRYRAADLDRMIEDDGAQVLAVSHQDRFFNREIIGVMVVSPNQEQPASLVIDSFVMSCRLLGRNIDTALLGWVCSQAAARGYNQVEGLFVPTEKNHLASLIYPNHGFTKISEHSYRLDLTKDVPVAIPGYFEVESP